MMHHNLVPLLWLLGNAWDLRPNLMVWRQWKEKAGGGITSESSLCLCQRNISWMNACIKGSAAQHWFLLIKPCVKYWPAFALYFRISKVVTEFDLWPVLFFDETVLNSWPGLPLGLTMFGSRPECRWYHDIGQINVLTIYKTPSSTHSWVCWLGFPLSSTNGQISHKEDSPLPPFMQHMIFFLLSICIVRYMPQIIGIMLLSTEHCVMLVIEDLIHPDQPSLCQVFLLDSANNLISWFIWFNLIGI